MWTLSISTLLLSATAVVAVVQGQGQGQGQDQNKESTSVLGFDAWTLRHGKTYASTKERLHRQGIFRGNLDTVQRHNLAYELGETLYAMSLEDSPFADLTDDEFQAGYLMDGQNCSATHVSSGSELPLDAYSAPHYSTSKINTNALPDFVDWRTKGVVTPVKNQQHCGSCWTFSTSGTLEAHTCIHGGQPEGVDCTKWTGLAEQQLLDCAWNYDNHGCNGGLPSHAFEYLKDAGGMDLEEVYTYRGNDNATCTACACEAGGHVADVFNITSYDEDSLVAAIAQIGPVSIAYQVSPDFRFYKHGIYDSWNATTKTTMCQSGPMDVNHAVVAVGYGQTEATPDQPSIPYYIVRNSWSATWGMEGYFWMKRGENLCGVSDCASFPIVPTGKKRHGPSVPAPGANNLFLRSSSHTETAKE